MMNDVKVVKSRDQVLLHSCGSWLKMADCFQKPLRHRKYKTSLTEAMYQLPKPLTPHNIVINDTSETSVLELSITAMADSKSNSTKKE